MARKTSPKLFDLVHAMTKAEKRYFKLSMHNLGERDTLHLKLFDLVNEQKTYDEEKLKRKLYGKAKLETKKFFVLKHELYKLLLKKMAINYEDHSYDYKVKQMLMQVRILYSKLLIEACKEILEQARKIVRENEMYSSLLEVLKWEKKIAYADLDASFLQKELLRIQAEEKKCLEILDTQTDYWFIFLNQLILTRTRASIESEEVKTLLGKAEKNPMLLCPEPKDSFESALFYYYSKSLLSYNANNWEGFYKYGKQALHFLEKHPAFKKEEFAFYISISANYIAACILLRKYEEASDNLEIMKPSSSIASNHRFRMLSRYYASSLTIHSEMGTFQKGLDLQEEIEKEERKARRSFPKDSYFFYAYFNFGLSRFDEADEWIKRYLDLDDSLTRKDLISASRILELLVYYEQENTQLLESRIRSVDRYLKLNHRDFGLEKEILRFLKKSFQFINKAEEREGLQKLKNKIQDFEENSSELFLLEYINIDAWLDSKLLGKSFTEIVSEMAKVPS